MRNFCGLILHRSKEKRRQRTESHIPSIPVRCWGAQAASKRKQSRRQAAAYLVRVPVLSKQQTSTAPASGMRNGSVQKMCSFIKASKLLFTEQTAQKTR